MWINLTRVNIRIMEIEYTKYRHTMSKGSKDKRKKVN